MNHFSLRVLTLFVIVGLSGTVGCDRQAQQQQAPPPAAAPAARSDIPTTELPPGHPPIDLRMQQLPAEALTQAGNPAWEVPAGWTDGLPSTVRRGSFAAQSPDGQTLDIAITVFPGDVGGPLANVNRWRAQIGLGPVTEPALAALTTELPVGDLTATVVDFAAEAPAPGKTHAQRTIVATLPQGGNSWFIKMTGDAPLVAANEPAFRAFVQSIRF